MTPRERESKLRLEIRRRQEHLGALLNRLQAPGPLLAGSVYVRKRRCGKPRCRCVRSHPHRDRVLAIRCAGRVRVRGLDPTADAAVEQAVAAWHGFRRQRVELVAACRGLLMVVDRLAGLRAARVGGARARP